MNVKQGEYILDVGCGLGATGSYLAAQKAIPFGIDISFTTARASSYPNGYKAVLQASAETLPFADLSFDGATFMGTLEHFLDPIKALCEVSRTLKPQEEICFLVPNSNFFLFRFLGGTGQIHEEPTPYEGWCRLFEKTG